MSEDKQKQEVKEQTAQEAMNFIDSMAPSLMNYVVKDRWVLFTQSLQTIRNEISSNGNGNKPDPK